MPSPFRKRLHLRFVGAVFAKLKWRTCFAFLSLPADQQKSKLFWIICRGAVSYLFLIYKAPFITWTLRKKIKHIFLDSRGLFVMGRYTSLFLPYFQLSRLQSLSFLRNSCVRNFVLYCRKSGISILFPRSVFVPVSNYFLLFYVLALLPTLVS